MDSRLTQNVPRSTSQSDETLNRGPRLRITFLCWLHDKPSSNQSTQNVHCNPGQDAHRVY